MATFRDTKKRISFYNNRLLQSNLTFPLNFFKISFNKSITSHDNYLSNKHMYLANDIVRS